MYAKTPKINREPAVECRYFLRLAVFATRIVFRRVIPAGDQLRSFRDCLRPFSIPNVSTEDPSTLVTQQIVFVDELCDSHLVTSALRSVALEFLGFRFVICPLDLVACCPCNLAF